MLRRLSNLFQEELGATAVEYAVILGLIFSVIIGTVAALGVATSSSLMNTSNQLNSATGP